MPRLSVWSIHLSLVYLAIGFTLGGLLLLNKGIPLSPLLWRFLAAHIEFLLYGWTVQLVMGAAFWILPRFSRPPRRGNEPLAWLSIGLLNLGIWLVGISPFLNTPARLILLGRALETGAALAFALHAWPRVKPAGAP